MKILNKILLAVIVLSANQAFAQSANTDSLIHRPFQITFISPMGTNGMESGKVVNNFSLNIFAGYAGGLDGVEFGGFFNGEHYYVKGAQFAGFGNVVLRDVQGAQFAGFFNVNRKFTRGAQFAGFTNIVTDSAVSAQFAGFVNVTVGSNKSIMAAGFANYAHGFNGLQAAGFVNVSTRMVQGAQIAGFANAAIGDIKGTQISGFLNLARKVSGCQIGFLNVCDSIGGVPIGFLSLVKHGYHHAEVGGSGTVNAFAQAKIGVEHFYNIFAAGLSPRKDQLLWGFGYGVGTDWQLGKVGVNFDLISYHINEDLGQFTADLNLLNRATLEVSYSFAQHFAIFAGPDFNVMVSQLHNPDTHEYGSAIVTKALYEYQHNIVNTKLWPGFNAGIRL